MSKIAKTPRLKPYAKLTPPERLRRMQQSFPDMAAPIVRLMDGVWIEMMKQVRRGERSPKGGAR